MFEQIISAVGLPSLADLCWFVEAPTCHDVSTKNGRVPKLLSTIYNKTLDLFNNAFNKLPYGVHHRNIRFRGFSNSQARNYSSGFVLNVSKILPLPLGLKEMLKSERTLLI